MSTFKRFFIILILSALAFADGTTPAPGMSADIGATTTYITNVGGYYVAVGFSTYTGMEILMYFWSLVPFGPLF
jgi:hypothetical protein